MSCEDAPKQELMRLFDIAIARLQERGIAARYDGSAIDTVLRTSDWQAAIQPIMALNHLWHQNVGNRIEDLLIAGQLVAGDSLDILGTDSLRIVVHKATQS